MKKIGFVDYYISEWHAENYPEWIINASEKMGEDFKVTHAYAERDISPRNGESTAAWCERKEIEMCESIDELCERCDYIVVLAPSDPDTHPRLAEAVLKHGKPTYIDKTFASNLSDAEFIFSVAEKYGTPFFSTSALRYAEELAGKSGYTRIITTGGGGSAEEYIIHQIEMAVKMLGVGATDLRATRKGGEIIFDVTYPDDRCATFIYGSAYSFTAYLSGGEKSSVYLKMESDFFAGLISDMLGFFLTKKPPFDPSETLEAMKLREMAVKAIS